MTQKQSYRLFGDRVLMERVPMKQGIIFAPELENSIARIGRVIAHGDGIYKDGRKNVKMHVNVGDLVYFQANAQMAASSAYDRGVEDTLINIPQGEVIAKVYSDAQDLTGFTVIGDWVLLKPFQREQKDQRIVIPDIAKNIMSLYFRVEQKGETVELDIKPGDEVLITQGYCHPIQIKGEDYGFILKQGVHGVVEQSALVS
jgi:co-chaperonin GroES (HSP10)